MLNRLSARTPRWIMRTVLIVIGLFGCPPFAAAQKTEPLPTDLQKADELREEVRRMISLARDRVFPSLVNIGVITVNYWEGKEAKGGGTGSGTIISSEGYIVTNQHVTRSGKKFKVTLANKEEMDAELVGEDPLTDLAVLKIDPKKLKDKAAVLPVAKFGDSGDLQVGDYVMAMGSPFALSRSVTLGIVSNAERVFAGGSAGELEEMQLEPGQRTGLFTNWIQHDALINPGNSGGPLVNLKGEIIGINELGGNAMGFAIPSNLAQRVVAELIKNGEVIRSYVGWSVKPLQRTGFDHGVLVNSVVKNGPADHGGIRAGDLIVAIDGESVTVRFPEEVPGFLKNVAERPVGSKVKVTYERGAVSHDAEITTDRMMKDRGDEAAFRAWGITGMQITDKMAQDRRLDNDEGVLVTSVRNGGPAALAEPPLAWGDVIRKVDQQAVKDLPGFVETYKKIMETEPLPEYVAVEFDRSGQDFITLIKPKPEKEDDPPREVRKGWIGVATQPVLKNLAEKLGHADVSGFRITRVYPGTRAADSDLKVGDIITGINGEKMKPKGMQDAGLLGRKLRTLDIDTQTKLTVFRDGDAREVTLALEPTRVTPPEARRDRNRDFELTVRDVTFFDRDENRWGEDVQGVIVEQVERAGWAGLGGLAAGDLIQRVGDFTVTGIDSYRKAIEQITKAQPERVVFVVLRGTRTQFQFVEPDWKPVTSNDKDVEEGRPAKEGGQ